MKKSTCFLNYDNVYYDYGKKPVKKGGKNMYKKSNINLKGFTIIEVVLVLAVAALIIAGVFAALPALQNSQKDNSEKASVNAILAKLVEYYGNNNSTWPATCTTSCNSTGSNFNSYSKSVLSTSVLNKVYTGTVDATAAQAWPTFDVVGGATCTAQNDPTKFQATAATGKALVVTKLSSGVVYCVNSK